eukprot:9486012-Pyramimonas_sp.AAC.3
MVHQPGPGDSKTSTIACLKYEEVNPYTLSMLYVPSIPVNPPVFQHNLQRTQSDCSVQRCGSPLSIVKGRRFFRRFALLKEILVDGFWSPA